MTEVYSIVIPTRDRADVLHHALKTACALPQPNVEIVVMDNCSEPDTRRVVRRFNDKRVKYFRTNSRLSMSNNWECGLQNVTGDYVFFLGDDDGILPDAIELAMIIHGWHKGKIIAWKPVSWLWPDTIVPEFRNVIHMHLSKRMELRDSSRSLKRFYNFEIGFDELPELYNSFIPTSLIKEVIARHGRYFFSRIPDVYSGIVNAYLSDQYVYSYRPLSVWGVSKHSTGISHSYSALDNKSVQIFKQENAQADEETIDKCLVESSIHEMAIADAMIKTKQRFFPDDDSININMSGVVRSLCQAAKRYSSGTDEVISHVLAVALKNKIAPDQYKIPTSFPGPEKLINNYTIDSSRDLVYFEYCTNPSIYPTIDKIVKLVSEMSMSATALPVVAEKEEHAVNDKTKMQTGNSNSVAPLADKVDARQPDSKAFAVMKRRLEAAAVQAPVCWSLKEHSSEQIRTYRRKSTLRKVARKVLNILNAK